MAEFGADPAFGPADPSLASQSRPVGFNPGELLALAGRCEQATGSDRRIDTLIEIEVNPDKPWIIGQKPGRFPQDPIYGTLADLREWANDASKDPPEISAPAYTASLDAAMTLYVRVPERVPSNPRLAVAEALRQRASDV